MRSMNRKLVRAGLCVFLFAFVANAAEKGNAAKPNIVFILADDLGYGDVRANNSESKIATPAMDGLAKAGIRFTDAHSGSAVCTPTRYGFITGRYCWRSRLKRGVLNGYSGHLIDPSRPTVASILKSAGYKTGCVGKWHLGMDLPRKKGAKGKRGGVDYTKRVRNSPNAQGFDYFFGITASLDFPPYVYIRNDQFTEVADQRFKGLPFPYFIRAGEITKNFKHVETLDVLGEEAVKFIKGHANKAEPFFLYVPLTGPHKPALPAKRFEGKSGLGPYGDFVMHVDDVIGKIDGALKSEKIVENTLVIVSSDNGSYMYRLDQAPARNRGKGGEDHVKNPRVQAYLAKHHKANAHWRGTKADIHEAGHRVPFMARWPAKIKAGRTSAETICLTDMLATFAELAGAKVPEGAGEDSFSVAWELLGGKRGKARPMVVNHSANGSFAVRDGKYKLILTSGSGGRGNPRSRPFQKPYQFYDLEADAGERKNLIDDVGMERKIEKMLKGARKLGIPVPKD